MSEPKKSFLCFKRRVGQGITIAGGQVVIVVQKVTPVYAQILVHTDRTIEVHRLELHQTKEILDAEGQSRSLLPAGPDRGGKA